MKKVTIDNSLHMPFIRFQCRIVNVTINICCLTMHLLTSICLIFIFSIVSFSDANSQSIAYDSIKEMLFFPALKSDTVVDIDDKLDDYRNKWYSMRLADLNEPRFLNITDNKRRLFRFTHIGLTTNPFTVRIEKVDSIVFVYYKQTGGDDDDLERPFLKEIQKRIQISDWNDILSNVEKAHFWDIHTHRIKEYSSTGCLPPDPAEWILEGLIGDKYHFVTRDSPECNDELEYMDLCNMFSDLFSDTEKRLARKKDLHLINFKLKI